MLYEDTRFLGIPYTIPIKLQFLGIPYTIFRNSIYIAIYKGYFPIQHNQRRFYHHLSNNDSHVILHYQINLLNLFWECLKGKLKYPRDKKR